MSSISSIALLGQPSPEASDLSGSAGTQQHDATNTQLALVGGTTQPQHDTELPALPTTPVANAADKIKYGNLYPYTIADVQISDEEDQPTRKGTRNINTKLMNKPSEPLKALNSAAV